MTEINFQEIQIQVIRRPYLRRLKLKMDLNGVYIHCGINIEDKDILGFIKDNESWINKSFQKIKCIKEKFPKNQFLEGEKIPFLGHFYSLKFDDSKSDFVSPYLILPQKNISKGIRNLYLAKSKKIIPQRVIFWAEKMNLKFQKIRIGVHKSQWGSCSNKGVLNFNAKLICAPITVIDYVVVHELSHLQNPNHSQKFWNLVESHVPNYKIFQNWLKNNQYAFEFLNKTK